MYLDVSRCILMYMNGTHQDTIKIHAGYIKIHQDTYPIGKHTKNDRKPHVTPGTWLPRCLFTGTCSRRIELPDGSSYPILKWSSTRKTHEENCPTAELPAMVLRTTGVSFRRASAGGLLKGPGPTARQWDSRLRPWPSCAWPFPPLPRRVCRARRQSSITYCNRGARRPPGSMATALRSMCAAAP